MIKALKDCEWAVRINEVHLQETQAQWYAGCKTMEKKGSIRFATGGVGSLNCVRLFGSIEEAKKGWMEFAKVNGIKKYTFYQEKKISQPPL